MRPVNRKQQTEWLVEQACILGFDLCGVAPADCLEELEQLPEWLARGYAGEMAYLHDARRLSPAHALPRARSIIVCALNYNTSLPYSIQVPPRDSVQQDSAPRGWISRYAWGDDYHEVLQGKLEALLAALREHIPEPFDARVYVDTGPVVERVAAKYAGLGWLAKNTCLINEKLGSWLLLGVILTTLELEPSLAADGFSPLAMKAPPPDLCGNCRLCIEACPTGAIVEPYVLDARRCISYLTIELRGSIPEEIRAPMGRQVFGCDICQDVCPWNRTAPATTLAEFLPRKIARAAAPSSRSEGWHRSRHSDPAAAGEESQLVMESPTHTRELAPRAAEGAGSSVAPKAERSSFADDASLFTPSLEWLASLNEEEFGSVFRSSTMKRTKWRGLVRNACVALGNSAVEPGAPAYARAVGLLERLAASDDKLIAEHAAWALGRLREHAAADAARSSS